jgi:hypothetical protein
MRRASVAACGPPDASRIMRNAMTRCISAPNCAASIQLLMILKLNKALSIFRPARNNPRSQVAFRSGGEQKSRRQVG